MQRRRRDETDPARLERADPLAAVISLLRPETVLSKVITGAGRWSVRYAAHDDPGFCVMLEGSCFLVVDGVGEVELAEGDFVLLPATPGFTMSSHRGLRPKRGDPTITTEVRHGDRRAPPSMRQLGGYFRIDRSQGPLVMRFLPALVHVRNDEPGAARLRRVVELLADEAEARRSGRELVLERLVEILLVEALRFRPREAAKSERGLLAGLADPGLARALGKLHADVARRWTVADLGRAAGMSRAAFAERFTQVLRMSPMEYVLSWRIALAKDLLWRERPSLAEVAERIGYRSASAFSVAFSRHEGCSPSAFARSLEGGPSRALPRKA